MKTKLIRQLEEAVQQLKSLDGDVIAVSNGELLSSIDIQVMPTPKGDMSIQVDISIED